MNKTKILLSIVLSIVILASIAAIHPAKASANTLYIQPSNSQSAGPTVAYQIFVDSVGASSTSGINGWDLVVTDNDAAGSILTPASISIAGNLLEPFGRVTETINCVNGGVGIAPNTPGNIGCDLRDGPGIVHDAAVLLGPATPTPISGMIAIITYNVGFGGVTNINFVTTSSPRGDVLTDGTAIPVAHSDIGATYGAPTTADFAVGATDSVPFNPGGTGSSTITLTSLAGFIGSVTLTNTVYPSSGLTVTCTVPSPNPLPAAGTSTATCTYNADTPALANSLVIPYVVTITATSGSTTHLASALVKVGDFKISGPLSVGFPTSNSGSATITLTGLNGFAGAVAISTSVNPLTGLTPNCATPVTIPSSASATSACTFSSSTPGAYTVTVTGTYSFGASGAIRHSISMSVNVGDFTVTAPSMTVTLPSGTTGTAAVTLTSKFSWNRQVTLSFSSAPIGVDSVTGTGNPCNSAAIPSAAGLTRECQIISTTPGTYTVTVTATCSTAQGCATSVVRSAMFTVTVTSPADFTVSATSPVPVPTSTQALSTITVTGTGGFTGTVALTDTLPIGLSCGAITPPGVTFGASPQTASLSCTSTVAGNYIVTIQGTSGGIVHSNTATFAFTSAAHPTTTALNCSPSTVAINQGSTCTATVIDTASTGATIPTGTVTFSGLGGSGAFSSTMCSLSAGSCSVTFAPATTTVSTISASYSGDATHASSSATSPATVSGTLRTTGTGVSCVPATSAIGQASMCTATVTDTNGAGSSTPAGNVLFSSTGAAGTFSAPSCTLSGGSCSVTFTPTASGTATIASAYSGDATHATSSGQGSVSVNVHPTTTTITCTPSSVAIDQQTSCTVTVTDTSAIGATTPTGSATFTSNGAGNFIGTCTLGGTSASASCAAAVIYTPTAIGTGTHSITGTYSGDATHSIGTPGTTSVTVTLRTTTTSVACSPASVPIGQASTCVATVADTNGAGAATPTGTVTFASTGGAGTFSASSCNLASGTCSITFTPNTTTASSISASYGGDASHSGSATAAAATVTGVQTTFTISATSPASVPAGTSATSTVTITGLSGFAGTVSLSDSPLPTGLACQTLNPTSVTLPPSSATSSLSCSSATPTAYTVTITATSGSLTQTTTATFTFSPMSQKDFTLSVSPTNITLVEDSPERAIVTLQSNGFDGIVDLSVKISPTGQGLAAHLVRIHVPLGPTSTQKIVLLVSGDEANAGDYTVTVTGTSGLLSHSASLKVIVTHPDDDQGGVLGQFFGWFLLEVSTSRWE